MLRVTQPQDSKSRSPRRRDNPVYHVPIILRLNAMLGKVKLKDSLASLLTVWSSRHLNLACPHLHFCEILPARCSCGRTSANPSVRLPRSASDVLEIRRSGCSVGASATAVDARPFERLMPLTPSRYFFKRSLESRCVDH